MQRKPCKTPECVNAALPKRTICSTCQSRLYKERSPERYFYLRLKANAKRRGKAFSLTFEQFKEFCFKTEYLDKKGRKKFSLHIDRINPLDGYTIDNIRVLTNTENVKRRWLFDRSQYGLQVRVVIAPPQIYDAPF